MNKEDGGYPMPPQHPSLPALPTQPSLCATPADHHCHREARGKEGWRKGDGAGLGWKDP